MTLDYTRPCSAVIAALFLLGCATPPELDPPWLAVKSQNFSIYTQQDEANARRLASDLELFRAAVGFFTNVRQLGSPVPVRVFVFANSRDYHQFLPDGTAGVTIAGIRSYVVVINGSSQTSSDRRISDRQVLYHEYVHFLLFNQGGHPLPRWFHEGFAEFLGTAERDGDNLIIGKTPVIRANALVQGGPMPLYLLLEASRQSELTGAGLGSFYAWSWLLVHYLSWEHEYPAGGSFSKSMDTYLELVAAGSEEVPAFERAWSISRLGLRTKLQAMVANGVQYGALSIEKLDYPEQIQVETLPRGEAARLLGELALGNQPPHFVRPFFELALEDDPLDSRAVAGLGDTTKLEGRLRKARPYFDRALELGPEQILNHLDRANYRICRAQADEDLDRRKQWLRSARFDLEQAETIDPRNPEIGLAMGQSYLVEGEDHSKAIGPLEASLEILPSSYSLQNTLLRAYVENHQSEKAHAMAGRMRVSAHSKQKLDWIDKQLAKLDE